MRDERLRNALDNYFTECDDSAIILDNPDFDNSIIGVSHDGRIIYDLNKMIEELSQDDNISGVDALEFIEFNTFGSLGYMGEKRPIICDVDRDELLDYYYSPSEKNGEADE